MKEISRQIMILNSLVDVTLEILQEIFEIFYGLRPEQGRWVIPQRKIKKEIIEANMIFAIRSKNM